MNSLSISGLVMHSCSSALLFTTVQPTVSTLSGLGVVCFASVFLAAFVHSEVQSEITSLKRDILNLQMLREISESDLSNCTRLLFEK